MEQASGRGQSNLGKPLHEAADRLRRRAVVIVLSDLLGDVEAFLWGLRRLRRRRHEVIVLHVLDVAEMEFPFERATLFRGLEDMPEVLAEPQAVRRAYLAALRKFLEQVQAGCRASGVDYQLARTDAPLDAPLRQLLTSRLRRRI
jgi:glycine/D-amino acid oxidase-like deaminating enzyme